MLKSRNIIFGHFLLKLIDLSCFGQILIFKLIDLTLSVPRGVLRSHGSIRHPWDLRSLRRPPKGDFSVKMHF